ncbi:tetratricopeptide repeat protein [Spongiimicrobium sp. 3-5]|uniref:tetratricopeptide repeat protein n=1 Tax=Spongiimicrobium sp. 3-5 TaxID=3332596 RepID=UPI003980A12D
MKLLFVWCFCLIPFFGLAQEDVIALVDTYISDKKYHKAERLLLSHGYPGTSDILRDKLGEVYSCQEKWEEAIDIYRELAKQYPENAEYHFRYGGVLAKKAQSSSKFTAFTLLGRLKEGFLSAAALDAEHVGARWALVDLYVSLPGIVGGSISKAQKYAEELKAISPLDGYLALGYVFEYDERPQKAKQYYLKALGYIDNLEKVERNQLNYQIGKVCGDYNLKLDDGIAHMKQYIADFTVKDGVPLDWAYYRLAKLYRNKGDKKLAVLWITKALEKRPNFAPALKEQEKINAL